MDLAVRNRKYGQGRTYVRSKKKLPICFDIHSLNLMCEYVLTDNRNIKRSAYINLRNLIELLDMEKYISDQDKYRRVLFIKKGLEAKLEQGLQNPLAIIKYVNGGLVDTDLIDIDTFKGLSNNEIDWINDTVSQTLSNTFLYEEAQYGADLFTRFLAADAGGEISRLGQEIQEYVAMLNTRFRQAKVQSVVNETFSLHPDVLREKLAEIHTELSSEYRKLLTGMQGVNQVTGGGFENTRCYLFLGVTGVGKSLSLLNIAYQMKKYNKNFAPKDPTKIPCIVYLTMENTVTETVDRLVKMSTGEDLRDHSPEEIVELMKLHGELYLTGDSPIDIIIKYQPNRSVDTSYLYTLVEDLEDEGYECICMIQDHIKRIRAASGQQDIRLELGDVVNELKTFAILKNIPVLTVSHLNRAGASVVDESSTRTKADLTRLLGKANIGESLLMLDNVDYACILNRETDADGNEYMVFKNIKQRIKTLRDYICQPFNPQNGLQLLEDFYSPVPIFKDSLYDLSLNQVSEQSRKVKKSGYVQSMDVYTPEEPNIYKTAELSGSRYSSADLGLLDGDDYLPTQSAYQEPEPVIEDIKPAPVRIFTKIA